MTQEEKQTMMKIKSLLNDMRYLIKEEDLKVVDDYHLILRKYMAEFR